MTRDNTTTSPLVPDKRLAPRSGPAVDPRGGRPRHRDLPSRSSTTQARPGKPDSGVRRRRRPQDLGRPGAQKDVPDLDAALRRLETYPYPPRGRSGAHCLRATERDE